jgi:hypothetical protein
MSQVNLINQFNKVAFKTYKLETSSNNESLTLQQLFNFIKETLEQNPSLGTASVNHLEFGGLMETRTVKIYDDNVPMIVFE